MASEAMKMAIRGNMHIDTMVIEVTDFKSEVKFSCDLEIERVRSTAENVDDSSVLTSEWLTD